MPSTDSPPPPAPIDEHENRFPPLSCCGGLYAHRADCLRPKAEPAPQAAIIGELATELGRSPATGLSPLDHLLEALADPAVSADSRVALYAVVAAIRLKLHRALSAQRAELVEYLVREGVTELGRIRLKATAVGVAWPCNAEGNWSDAGIQDAMEQLAGQPATSAYIRRIPAHLEIATAELGADVARGVPSARQLHRELKDRSWRTEEGRSLSLELKP